MAGGEGSRLRPLTCDLPKPMVRLCGRPILAYILDLLEENGFTQALLTTRYLAEVIHRQYPDGRHGSLALTFVEEERPLGTAGGVKHALPQVEEPFLVISGDALCDFDLKKAMAFHLSHGKGVTILVKKVADPREYGLVVAGEDGTITGFVEKPDFTQAVSDLANTGVYLLSPQVLSQIPAGENWDFAKDLFPALMEGGETLMAYEETGYWCDVGDLTSFRTCQQDILHGRVRCSPAGSRDAAGNWLAGGEIPPGVTLYPPVYIGPDVTLEPGTVLEKGTVVDRGCRLLAGRYTASVLLENCQVGRDARLTGALLCHGATLGPGAMVFEGAAIGAGAVVGKGAIVRPGVKIWPGKEVEAGAICTDHLQYGPAQAPLFDEAGITGTPGVRFTPEQAARIGAAAGTITPGPLALGWDEGPAAEALAAALATGIRSTGREVLSFGLCRREVFTYALTHYAVGMALYLQGGESLTLRLLAPDGLPIPRDVERKLEGALARGEFARSPAKQFGPSTSINGLEPLYRRAAAALAPQGLGGMSLRLKGHPASVALARQILEELGCETHHGLTFYLGEGGALTAHGKECGALPREQLLALCALAAFRRGEDVALPYDAPRTLETLAKETGRTLHRYLRCPAQSTDVPARRLAAAQHWGEDSIWQTVLILALLKETKEPLRALIALLPPFALAKGQLLTQENPAALLAPFRTPKPGIAEGVLIETSGGTVLLQPNKQGNALKILAEAPTLTAARALYTAYQRELTGLCR